MMGDYQDTAYKTKATPMRRVKREQRREDCRPYPSNRKGKINKLTRSETLLSQYQDNEEEKMDYETTLCTGAGFVQALADNEEEEMDYETTPCTGAGFVQALADNEEEEMDYETTPCTGAGFVQALAELNQTPVNLSENDQPVMQPQDASQVNRPILQPQPTNMGQTPLSTASMANDVFYVPRLDEYRLPRE